MTWLGRALLGSGRIDEPLRAQLLAAGPRVFAEELSGSYVLRQPGGYTRNPTRGAVVVTAERFVLWARRAKTVDVPLDREWLARIGVMADRGRLVTTVQLGNTLGVSLGTFELRLRTPEADRVVALLGAVR